MKTLLFFRHAKAVDLADAKDDWSRTITSKGEMKTKKNFQAIRDRIGKVDAVVSSAAWRTKQTAEIIAHELGIDYSAIQYHSRLRHGSGNTHLDIIDLISTFPSKRETVILVGHNPMLSETAMHLTDAPLDYIPKSGIVGLTFNVEDRSAIKKSNIAGVWQYLGDE